MIDVTKPLGIERGMQTIKPIDYVANAQGNIIVRYKTGGLAEYDEVTGLSPGGHAKLVNVPVTHRRLVALYNIRGSVSSIAVVDQEALDNCFIGMPGVVIAKQWVTITEGEGMKDLS
jgi:hypothetical protein